MACASLGISTATLDGLTHVRIGLSNLQGTEGNLAGSLLYSAGFNFGTSAGSSSTSASVRGTGSAGAANGILTWNAVLDPTSISLTAPSQSQETGGSFEVYGTYAYGPYSGYCGTWENSLGVGRGEGAYGGYCPTAQAITEGYQTKYTTTHWGITGANVGAQYESISNGSNSGSVREVGQTAISYYDKSCGFLGLGTCTFASATPYNYFVDAGIYNVISDRFIVDGYTPAGASYFYDFTTPNAYDPRDIVSVNFADYSTTDGSSLSCVSNVDCVVLADVTSTPEPTSIVLLATGLVGVFGAVRRKRTARTG